MFEILVSDAFKCLGWIVSLVERIPDDIGVIIDVNTTVEELVFVCSELKRASFTWNIDEVCFIRECLVEFQKLSQNLVNTFFLVFNDFIDFIVCD